MHRTFHSRVDWWYWLLMSATAFLLFDCFWFHNMIPALFAGLAMIFEIEMLIHTRYVVTADGKLQIESGRFAPNRVIALSDILSLQPVRNYAWGPALSSRKVEIIYQSGTKSEKILLSPQSIPDFIQWIQKKHPALKKKDSIREEA